MGGRELVSSSSLLLMFLCSFLPRAHTCSVMYHQLVKGICSDGRLQALQEIRYVHCTYMIKSCTCICKGRQGIVRRQTVKKSTELPQMGFEPVTTGLLVQCSAN